MILYAKQKTGYEIDYINKMPIFELLELLEVIKNREK